MSAADLGLKKAVLVPIEPLFRSRDAKVCVQKPTPHSPLIGFFPAVLFLRLIALARLTGSPFLFPAHGDMHFYNDWALRILRGQWTDHLAFYGLPLYAYLLAAIYKVFGYSPFLPAFVQACLDAGTAVIIYQLRFGFSEKSIRKPTEFAAIAAMSSALSRRWGGGFARLPRPTRSSSCQLRGWFSFFGSSSGKSSRESMPAST